MRIHHRMASLLFDSADAIGVGREELTRPLGLDATRVADARGGLDWDTFVALLDVLSNRVGGDVAQLHEVGRHMIRTPPFVFVQRIARTVFSLHDLYRAGDRWFMPSNVPHLHTETWFPAPDRMHFRCAIPQPYLPSEPYLHIFVGLLVAIPTMIGLPPARIALCTVTDRELSLVLDLPTSDSVGARLRRGVRAFWFRSELDDLLARQGREVVEGLEAAQRSVAEIQALFDRLPDLVIIHRDASILWANRAAAATLGYEPGALVGTNMLDIVAPGSRALTEQRLRGEFDDGGAPFVERNLLRRDGTEVLVEVFPAQVVTFGGRPARLVVAHDVTERTRLRERILAADRMASIGMLAAGVAHEVNTPLAYVLNNVEIARRELSSVGDAGRTGLAALGVALEGIERIRVIIRDLLALSRTEGDVAGSVDVAAVVESTLVLARPSIAERAELETVYEPVPLASGTAARVGQVLLNLVSNALEAMPVETRDRNRLRVAVRPAPNGGVVIEVEDNGVGITNEHSAHIFDPFFTTKAEGSGTGLGLTISQRLVTEIGGELSFESAPGRGSTFRVRLGPYPDRATNQRA
jgi:PAS domain S-box-containing protein